MEHVNGTEAEAAVADEEAPPTSRTGCGITWAESAARTAQQLRDDPQPPSAGSQQ